MNSHHVHPPGTNRPPNSFGASTTPQAGAVSAPSTPRHVSVGTTSTDPGGVSTSADLRGTDTGTRLQFTAAESLRLEETFWDGWPPSPPPRARKLTQHMCRISTVLKLAQQSDQEWVMPSDIVDVFVRVGWRPIGTSINTVVNFLGMKGLRLEKAPAPNGGFMYRLPDIPVEQHLHMLGYDI